MEEEGVDSAEDGEEYYGKWSSAGNNSDAIGMSSTEDEKSLADIMEGSDAEEDSEG